MNAQYPTNVPFIDGSGEQALTNYYDREQSPQRMDSAIDRTAQYVSSLNPSTHSHHHSNALPPLTIRRHTPGSTDPFLQNYPVALQTAPSGNVTSSSNVRVTIKRNNTIPDQTLIQPILYPVAIYVNNPEPPPPSFDSKQIQLVQPIENIPKPPSPKKILPAAKKPPTPPVSPNRYETELLNLSPSRSKHSSMSSPRRPIRTDNIPPTPTQNFEPVRVRSSQMIVEEYDDYDEHYRVPSVYTVPQKTISYRTAPGMTTRELQNDEFDGSGQANYYVETPVEQTVTYRIT